MANIPSKEDLKSFNKQKETTSARPLEGNVDYQDGHGSGKLPMQMALDFDPTLAKKHKREYKRIVKELKKDPEKLPIKLGDSFDPEKKLESAKPLQTGQYDSQRVTPVPDYIIHHPVSPDYSVIAHWSDQDWKNWFNTIGRGRTYAGWAHSYHYDPVTGEETFSAVPVCFVPNGDTGSLATDTFRWIILFDPIPNTGWQCGDWNENCRSIGGESATDYSNQEAPINLCKCIAQFIKENVDSQNGASTRVFIHREITNTGCPMRLGERRDLIVDMTNHPENYDGLQQFANNQQPQAKPQIVGLENEMYIVNSDDVALVQILTGAIAKNAKGEDVSFNTGDKFEVAAYVDFNNKRWYLTQYSQDKGIYNGVASEYLTKESEWKPTPQPSNCDELQKQVDEFNNKIATGLLIPKTDVLAKLSEITDAINAMKRQLPSKMEAKLPENPANLVVDPTIIPDTFVGRLWSNYMNLPLGIKTLIAFIFSGLLTYLHAILTGGNPRTEFIVFLLSIIVYLEGLTHTSRTFQLQQKLTAMGRIRELKK